MFSCGLSIDLVEPRKSLKIAVDTSFGLPVEPRLLKPNVLLHFNVDLVESKECLKICCGYFVRF